MQSCPSHCRRLASIYNANFLELLVIISFPEMTLAWQAYVKDKLVSEGRICGPVNLHNACTWHPRRISTSENLHF